VNRAVVVFTRRQLCSLQLQLCLVSSSPSKRGQVNFEYCHLSHKTSSGIQHIPHFGKLASCPITALSFYDSLDLYSVLVDFWEVGLLLHPCCQPLYLSQPLLNVSVSSGRLACHLTPTFSLGCFSCIHSLRVQD
jgi:hypothetical protein